MREVKEEIDRIGRPLAPQSIEGLEDLFESYEPLQFDEHIFAEGEMKAKPEGGDSEMKEMKEEGK